LILVDAPLTEDAAKCWQLIQESDTDFHRHQFVRAAFAHIEGTVYCMKQYALAHDEASRGAIFSDGERVILREENYYLTEQGALKPRRADVPFLANFRFAYDAVVKALGKSYTLPVGQKGWQDLQESQGIRNRLTHPKVPRDLEVTDAQLKTVRRGYDWFLATRLSAVRSEQRGRK
jgi:hypothetical protein